MSDPARGESAAPRARHRVRRAVLLGPLALVIAGMAAWCSLFISVSPLPGAPLRMAMAIAFPLATLALFVLSRRRARSLLIFLAMFAAVATWYFAMRPSHDRDWVPDVARLPSATVNGNLVTIRDIRNFDYRSEADFTPAYYDKTFDLDRLQSLDLLCVYWGSPSIAHVIASFGFDGGDFVAFSIELRPRKGQIRSTLRSLFRNYELIYVVADERDVIRVRTNYRVPEEQVYLYRVRLPIENQRKLFLSYAAAVDSLSRTPQWYNLITDNCTTGVLERTKDYERRGRYNWKVLLSGYAGEYAYECGMLDTSMPFAELRERSLVNAKAKAADQAADFSLRIREGLPMPKPYTMEEFLAGN